MSAVLVVLKDKKQVAKVTLPGHQFIIGRASDCDLTLDEALASRQHVEIILEQGRFFIKDRGSRNGTLLNGQKLTERLELKDGDEIAIGAMRLNFLTDAAGDSSNPDPDATKAASLVDMEKELPGLKVAAKKERGPLRVKLKISGGPLSGGVFRDWESPLKIGRDVDKNHVVLLDDAVTKEHAQIVQEGERYFIEDLGSANGTFLDNVKIRRSQLARGQKIRVGTSTLAFDLVDVRKQQRQLNIALITLISVCVLFLLFKLLQPPDRAGDLVDAARLAQQHGELKKAMDDYQAALKIEPNRPEAVHEMRQLKMELDAREALRQAEAAAQDEKYDTAKELVYRVLRDFPKSTHALELEAIIKSIENANVALKAQNWSDAESLLTRARDAYPKSELISMRLGEAEKEMNAQQSLLKAKDAYIHKQSDMAESLLKNVPSTSVYFTEAREYLDKIDSERKRTEASNKAQGFYREGKLTEALTELEKGLETTPNDQTLLELRDRLRKMETLASPLAAAETLKQADGVDALLRGRVACDDVLNAEPDPLNSVRKRAQDMRDQIGQWLQNLSTEDTQRGEELLAAGKRKDAWNAFHLAVKENESNQKAAQAEQLLYKQIEADCMKLYQQGIQFEELRINDKARESFQKIVEIGVPSERYFEKATLKLKQPAP